VPLALPAQTSSVEPPPLLSPQPEAIINTLTASVVPRLMTGGTLPEISDLQAEIA
jgi:hypothetical protein